MKYVICSVYDRAAEMYGRPMFMPAVGSAIRSFSDEINRAAADNEMYKHPDDYDLYQFGSFDDSDGTFSVVPKPSVLIRGKDAVIAKE